MPVNSKSKKILCIKYEKSVLNDRIPLKQTMEITKSASGGFSMAKSRISPDFKRMLCQK